MKLPKLTPEQQQQADEISRKFKEALKKRPEVSDEDYKRGMTFPGPGGSD